MRFVFRHLLVITFIIHLTLYWNGFPSIIVSKILTPGVKFNWISVRLNTSLFLSLYEMWRKVEVAFKIIWKPIWIYPFRRRSNGKRQSVSVGDDIKSSKILLSNAHVNGKCSVRKRIFPESYYWEKKIKSEFFRWQKIFDWKIFMVGNVCDRKNEYGTYFMRVSVYWKLWGWKLIIKLLSSDDLCYWHKPTRWVLNNNNMASILNNSLKINRR